MNDMDPSGRSRAAAGPEPAMDGIAADAAGLAPPSRRPAMGIARSSLPEQVAGRLRDMIVQNDLAPGERIRERAISAELNVSRTPLREALQVLAAEGLVELLPNRGAIVAKPSPGEVREMLEVQGVLEEFAGQLFCANAREEDIAEICAVHFEMMAAYSRRERLQYFKLNQRIHRMIVELAGNRALLGMYTTLSARLYRFRYQPNLKPEHWQSAVAEHEQILAAIEARDGARLGRVLKAHLQTTWVKLSGLLTEED